MKRSGRSAQRLAAVFLTGCILLSHPILSLFGRPANIAGVPILYVYVFAIWASLIGVMALIITRTRD